MAITMIWCPEGTEPQDSDFRVLKAPPGDGQVPLLFETWSQVTSYLKKVDWADRKPWVKGEENELVTPDEIEAKMKA